MRVHWMPTAAITGILLLCTGATAIAQGYMTYPVTQSPPGQMSMLPQYRVQPMPPAQYVPYGVVAPSFHAYGSSFDARVEHKIYRGAPIPDLI